MMRPRSIRIITIALVIVTGIAFVLGWDTVFEQMVTDSFVEGQGKGTLDF